jgi:hypothetical protein
MIIIKIIALIVICFLGSYATYYFNVEEDDTMLFKLSMILLGSLMALIIAIVLSCMFVLFKLLFINFILK